MALLTALTRIEVGLHRELWELLLMNTLIVRGMKKAHMASVEEWVARSSFAEALIPM